MAEYPENERVTVFPLQMEGEDVLVDIETVRAEESSSEHHVKKRNFKMRKGVYSRYAAKLCRTIRRKNGWREEELRHEDS